MSGDQLEEAEVDRLGAAVFEQRRLSHMLRQRGAEIEALQSDRERLAERESKAREREEDLRRKLREFEEKAAALQAEVGSLSEERNRATAELKQAQYDTRRVERRAVDDLAEEQKRAGRRLEEARTQLSSLTANRDSVTAELKRAEYEARRAERRVAKVDRDAAEARKRARLQLDALRAELRTGLASRDEVLKREQQLLVECEETHGELDQARGELDGVRGERDEALGGHRRALEAFEQAQVAAAETARSIEASALELGRAEREVEQLVGWEREQETLLAGSDQTLAQVAGHLRRVRASRSWRWGHAIARTLRALTFRRRSERSALDNALERLGDEDSEPSRDAPRT